MVWITRRRLLQGGAGMALFGAGLASDAFAIEPAFMLDVTTYHLQIAGWPTGFNLKIAAIADIHACKPWMDVPRIRHIADVTNDLNPDLIVLLGDFNAGHNFVTGAVFPHEWADALSHLRAPMGCWGVLGNHDWWHGALPSMRGDHGASVKAGMQAAGIHPMENDAIRLSKDGHALWLLGLGDQMAHIIQRGQTRGIDDLPGALAKVEDDAPIVLLAHEPYIFKEVPERVALTLCGHTHGGQVNLPFLRRRWYKDGLTGYDSIYGHTQIGAKHMVISGGLGTSALPVRFLRPPEIIEINVTAG